MVYALKFRGTKIVISCQKGKHCLLFDFNSCWKSFVGGYNWLQTFAIGVVRWNV
jgi:hypothetical protein